MGHAAADRRHGAPLPRPIARGSERAFELLIELKVHAAIHFWEASDGSLYQPDAYIRSWCENYDAKREANVRRVGTLTKTGPEIVVGKDEMRAADVTWAEARTLLADLLESGDIERGVVAVAVDFAAALDEFVVKPVEVPQTDDPNLAWAYVLFQELVPEVAARLTGGKPGAKPGLYKDFVSAYVCFDVDGSTYRLWMTVTSEGGRYNTPGAKPRLWLAEVYESKLAPAVSERFEAAGFAPLKDNEASTTLRAGLDVTAIQAAGDEGDQRAFALEWIVTLLAPTGIVSDSVGSSVTAPNSSRS